MPVMDGYTCADKIRHREDELKNLPIIAVTANVMDANRTRCEKSGINDIIKKPIKLDLLRKTINRYIKS